MELEFMQKRFHKGAEKIVTASTAILLFAVHPLIRDSAGDSSSLQFSFSDVAAEAGLVERVTYGNDDSWKYILETTGCGVAFFDYDNDGWLDIFLVNGSKLQAVDQGKKPSNHLYHNNQNATFTDVTAEAGLTHSGWGQGVCIGDYDNDGFDDLFVTYWGQNVLYRNKGNGRFEDVTEASGLSGKQRRWGTGCAFLDYDRDGYLDLFVANYLIFDPETAPQPGTGVYCQHMGIPVNCGPRGLPQETALLYHNDRNGTFTNVTKKAGIDAPGGSYGLGVLADDFDNDGWPDVYLASDASPSRLFRNMHNGTFSDVAVLAGCAFSSDGKPQSGMGVAAGDYNGDGWLDIFKTNFSFESSNLFQNNRDGTFTDRAEQAGIARNTRVVGWGCGFADFDNDSWLDIIQVNGHVYPEIDRLKSEIRFKQKRNVYRNLGDGRFQDVSDQAGPSILQPSVSRGSAMGDFDNDGDVDVLISNINDVPSLLRNDLLPGQHWIEIKAIGARSNRSAIGTRIRCITGNRQQLGQIRSGGSFLSQSDLRVHFGLGKATRVDSLEVQWPNGSTDRFRDIGIDQIHYIDETSGIRTAKLARP
jgi:enediyne biosynthesis protein E4